MHPCGTLDDQIKISLSYFSFQPVLWQYAFKHEKYFYIQVKNKNSRTPGDFYNLFCIPALAGATYTSVTVISASMRKKDDTINHFFGGLAAGAVFGARCKANGLNIFTC